jgi:hypothetical protein
MESLGAVETVDHIWTNCDDAYVATIVTDEDSTTRSKLSDSMADLVNAGRMAESERRYAPKVAGRLGLKKDDHGLLPLAHPAIKKLSDSIHYVKNYLSELYVLVNASKKKEPKLQGKCNAANPHSNQHEKVHICTAQHCTAGCAVSIFILIKRNCTRIAQRTLILSK